MDFSFSDEQRSMADLAARILGDRTTEVRLKGVEQADGPRFDRDLWAVMAEAGLLGLAIPEAHGGAGRCSRGCRRWLEHNRLNQAAGDGRARGARARCKRLLLLDACRKNG